MKKIIYILLFVIIIIGIAISIYELKKEPEELLQPELDPIDLEKSISQMQKLSKDHIKNILSTTATASYNKKDDKVNLELYKIYTRNKVLGIRDLSLLIIFLTPQQRNHIKLRNECYNELAFYCISYVVEDPATYEILKAGINQDILGSYKLGIIMKEFGA